MVSGEGFSHTANPLSVATLPTWSTRSSQSSQTRSRRSFAWLDRSLGPKRLKVGYHGFSVNHPKSNLMTILGYMCISVYMNMYLHRCIYNYIYIFMHTLAQNGHCELWSGVHLTCKEQLSHLKRLDWVFDGNLMLVLNLDWSWSCKTLPK